MKALETRFMGMRVNDMTTNDALLVMEFVRGTGMAPLIDKYEPVSDRHAQIGQYFVKLQQARRMAGLDE